MLNVSLSQHSTTEPNVAATGFKAQHDTHGDAFVSFSLGNVLSVYVSPTVARQLASALEKAADAAEPRVDGAFEAERHAVAMARDVNPFDTNDDSEFFF